MVKTLRHLRKNKSRKNKNKSRKGGMFSKMSGLKRFGLSMGVIKAPEPEGADNSVDEATKWIEWFFENTKGDFENVNSGNDKKLKKLKDILKKFPELLNISGLITLEKFKKIHDKGSYHYYDVTNPCVYNPLECKNEDEYCTYYKSPGNNNTHDENYKKIRKRRLLKEKSNLLNNEGAYKVVDQFIRCGS
jgi:hypothetical protein